MSNHSRMIKWSECEQREKEMKSRVGSLICIIQQLCVFCCASFVEKSKFTIPIDLRGKKGNTRNWDWWVCLRERTRRDCSCYSALMKSRSRKMYLWGVHETISYIRASFDTGSCWLDTVQPQLKLCTRMLITCPCC